MEAIEPIFRKRRLESLTKEQLIRIILHPDNSRHFQGLFRADLEKQSHEALVNVIFRIPTAFIDNNYIADLNHLLHIQTFEQWTALLKNSMDNRISALNTMTVDQLVAVMTYPANASYFKGTNRLMLLQESRENLIKMIMRRPEVTLTSNPSDRSYNPFYWRARPNQADHIQRLIKGLMDPTNEARVAWDGSDMGKGKTASAILTAIGLRVRFILIISPDNVVKKWHDALAPLGLFDYRIATYSGIKGTSAKAAEQWAKYKPDPDRLTNSEDLEWLRIYSTGKTGKGSHRYDWSHLPNQEENNNLGGCLVIWDEVHNAKGRDSKIGVCFNEFIYYLHREKTKYVRSLFLSGTVMEAPKDLPYLIHAYGYIAHPTPAELNGFIRNTITPSFKQLIGVRDWEPEYDRLVDGHDKLLRFIRTVVGRENRFSQIPEGIPYVVYLLGFIRHPSTELMNKFRDGTLIPKFRDYIDHDGQHNWEPEFDELVDPDHYVRAWLQVLTHDEKYRSIPIQEILDSTFDNPISFQGIQMRDEEFDQFIQINREIEDLMMDIARGDAKFDGGTLGAIQRALSAMEVFKLTPFSDLARRILNTPYENGAQGSVVISVTRNASVRHFAWRLEAILWIQALEAQTFASEQDKVAYLLEQKAKMIAALLDEYVAYSRKEKNLIENNQKLQLKSSFKILTDMELRAMSFEDVAFEYNKWIKYLDAKNFEYVCIYVGDLGINPTDFNLDSADEADWIKESKAMNRTTKEEMKVMFQSNARRVFITNILIGREGIDLHDTSEDGMHPRTAIISPGIVARYLLQMLGRFVREGQTSNAVRIIGFIDNVRGVKSWEAMFMAKLNAKIRSIQMLHSGETKIDIEKNIEKDGVSILMQIINDMKTGKAQSIQTTGESVFNQDLNNDNIKNHVPSLVNIAPSAHVDKIQNYLVQQYAGGKKSPGGNSPIKNSSTMPVAARSVANTATLIPQRDIGVREKKTLAQIGINPEQAPPSIQPVYNQPLQNQTLANSRPVAVAVELAPSKLMIKVNPTHIYLDLKHNPNRDYLKQVITQTLVSSGLNPNTFLVIGNHATESGILLYRPAIAIQGISEQELVALVLSAISLQPDGQAVPEGAYDVFNFTPDLNRLATQEVPDLSGLSINNNNNNNNNNNMKPVLTIIIENEGSMLVFPREPVLTLFPEMLLQPELLVAIVELDEAQQLGDAYGTDAIRNEEGLRFTGTEINIMAAYYAVMAIGLIASPESFSDIERQDLSGLLAKSTFAMRNVMQGTDYYVVSKKQMIKMLNDILSAVPVFQQALANGAIFINYNEGKNDMARVTITPAYQSAINQLLGQAPISNRRPQ